MGILIFLIDFMTRILLLFLIAYVVISYFMDPYQPIRRRLDSIVEPLLSPIRRVVRPVGMLDFSPLILIVFIQIISWLLILLIRRIAS